jgi:hypothetical protein
MASACSNRQVSLLVLITLLIGSLCNIRLVAPVPPAAAQATLEVTNGNNSGPGSLRRAVAAAMAGDRITFADSVDTVTLTSDQLTIDKTLTIDGGDGVTIERDQTATISHSASGGGYDSASIDEVSVTVRDNDNRIYLPIIVK